MIKSYCLKFITIILLSISTMSSANSQSYNGQMANDWTMTDLDGNTWNLYTLIGEGKTVYLDFSATWCGICWNLHSSDVYENIYNQYGPDGTDEVMVFFIELDPNTDEACLYGSENCNGNSSGDWTEGVSYPIISASNQDILDLKSEYNFISYPSLNVVCNSGRKFSLPNSTSVSTLSSYIQSCNLSIDDVAITDAECNGSTPVGAVDITISGGYNNLTYSWNNGETTEDISELEAGTFYCTVRDENLVFVTVIADVLSPSPTLDLIVDTETPPSCYNADDGEISVSGTGGMDYTYTWDNGLTGPTNSGLAGGIYTITVEDENGCTTAQTIDITGPDEILIESDVTPHGCDSLGSASISILQGEGTFTYDIGDGPQVSNTFIDLTGGDYTVVVTNSDGCTSEIEITIEEEDLPSIIGPTEDIIIGCLIESVIIDFSNSEAGADIFYKWTTIDGQINSGGNSPIVSVGQAGIYTLTITNGTTNCSVSESIEVTSVIQPVADAGLDHTFLCNYTNYLINAENSSSGEDYLINWSTSNGNILGGENTLQLLIDEPGTYILNILDVNNQCTDLDTVIISLYDNTPSAEYTFEKDIYTIAFTSTSEGDGNTYAWNFGDSTTSSDENPSHTFSGPGTYNVCLTTSNECGTDQKCRSIIVNSVEISISNELQHVSCNGAQDGSITIENTSALTIATYMWSSGQTTASIDGLSGGDYTLTMTSEEGIFASYVFTIEEAAALIAEVTTIDNQNGIIDITITGGIPPYRTIWNNGSQDEDQSGLEEGTYAVSIKDDNNCKTEITGIVISTTSINDVSLRSNIDIYPNPVRDVLLMDFKSNITGSASINIYNTEGKVVYREKIKSLDKSIEIDVNHLPPGYYYIRLKTLQESALINFIKT